MRVRLRGAGPLLRPFFAILITCGLLAWFCSRDEEARRAMLRVRDTASLVREAPTLLWPPWRALRLYVSIDDDVSLYYELSRVVLGEAADAEQMLRFDHRPDPAEVAALRARLAQARGRRWPTGLQLGFPPLSVLLMVLPRLAVDTLGAYRVAFAVLLALLYLGAWGVAVAGAAGLPRRVLLGRMALVTACMGPVLVARLDVLPALLVVAALGALARGWALAAGLLLVLGGAAKLYPLFLLPVWAALLWGWGGAARRQAVALLGGPALLGGLGLLLGGLPALGEHLRLFARRPVQIESVVGAVLHAAGWPSDYGFGSNNLLLPPWVPMALDGLLGGAVLALAAGAGRWAARHRDGAARRQALTWFAVATVLVVITTSKVLSPQYLVWLVPPAAMLPGRAGRLVLLGVCAAMLLTQVYVPFMYSWLMERRWPLLLLVLVRNGLLVGLAAGVLGVLVRSGRRDEALA
ncbi:MAG: hypothetical protein RMK29_15770 [Myxococcales bacterium]|nr:hypothetical protein [Myxococcota bacterium]MDW8283174.1 hypothetical protein [Myxococcales bacterium]